MTEEYTRNPAGKFQKPTATDKKSLQSYIDTIASFPDRLSRTIEKLPEDQLASFTLPGVWTVNQVIHHLADSHINSFVRTKLILTEDNPTVKPYDEGAWSKLSDVTQVPARVSLDILKNLHERWVTLFNSLGDEAFERTYFHPEHKTTGRLADIVALYAWHGNHHMGYIQELIARRGW